MKKAATLLIISILGAVFYCFLMESFFYINIILGFAVSFLGAILLHRKTNIRFLPKVIWEYIVFAVLLLLNIFKSAYIVIIGMFRERNAEIITKKCEGDISCVVYANGITLTPGSVTLEQEDNTLTVLKFKDNLDKETIND